MYITRMDYYTGKLDGMALGLMAGTLVGHLLSTWVNGHTMAIFTRKVWGGMDTLKKRIYASNKQCKLLKAQLRYQDKVIDQLQEVVEEQKETIKYYQVTNTQQELQKMINANQEIEQKQYVKQSSDAFAEFNSMIDNEFNVLDKIDDILSVGKKIGSEPIFQHVENQGCKYATVGQYDSAVEKFRNFKELTPTEEYDIKNVFTKLKITNYIINKLNPACQEYLKKKHSPRGSDYEGIIGLDYLVADEIVNSYGYKLHNVILDKDGKIINPYNVYDATVICVSTDTKHVVKDKPKNAPPKDDREIETIRKEIKPHAPEYGESGTIKEIVCIGGGKPPYSKMKKNNVDL
jgi:hypothetical protein